MPKPADDLASELAYVKALAEEGRNAPLVGGILYVIWGVVIAAASLLTYLAASGAIAVPFIGGLWFWVGALLVGWAASFLIGSKSSAKPGGLTIGNKTANAVWFAVGVFMTSFWIAAFALQGHLKSAGVESHLVFGLMFPVAFGVYGIAFYATAVAARLDFLRGFAIAAWLFSLAALYFLGDLRQLLIGAAGSLVCALLPGLILMRREPRDIV